MQLDVDNSDDKTQEGIPSVKVASETPSQKLDRFSEMFSAVERMREQVAEVPVQEHIYGPIHAYSERDHGISEQHYLSQRQAITSGRIGDILFPSYNGRGNAKTKEAGLCLCGEGKEVTKQTLRRWVLHEIDRPLYYLGLFPEEKTPYLCKHIQEGLERAFPVHYRAWSAMRRELGKIQGADSAVPLEQMAQFEPDTLRQDCGLLRFIQAIGPEVKGRSLYHVGPTSDQRPQAYQWTQDKRAKDRTRDEQALSGRFDAIMQRCRREGIAVGWKDREEFIKDALELLPERAKVKDMRLRFDGAAENGFNRRTMRWEHKKVRERKKRKADKEEKALMLGMEVAFRLQEGMTIEEAFAEAEEVVKST